jgi:hypothetical protein
MILLDLSLSSFESHSSILMIGIWCVLKKRGRKDEDMRIDENGGRGKCVYGFFFVRNNISCLTWTTRIYLHNHGK